MKKDNIGIPKQDDRAHQAMAVRLKTVTNKTLDVYVVLRTHDNMIDTHAMISRAMGVATMAW